MKKPEWIDAPEWANHLWIRDDEDIFCWSRSMRKNSKALWVGDVDTQKERFRLWPECWQHVERRP